jgi:misacylated tRNA(Ala) deacylase
MAKEYYAPMHTTEHILNQTMVKLFECDRSFSNHIEKKKSKCDYKFTRNLTDEEIYNIELKVNEEIEKNHRVYEEYIPVKIASERFNLERLPDQDVDTVRVINIGDYDSCLCIGNHVKNTEEIEGKFKIISTNFDNNVLRIRFKLISH